MDKLERIDALLELDVLIRKLGFFLDLAQLLLDHLLGALRERREASTISERNKQDGVSQRSQRSRMDSGDVGKGCKIGGGEKW